MCKFFRIHLSLRVIRMLQWKYHCFVVNLELFCIENNGEETREANDKKSSLANVKYGEPSTVDLKNVNEEPSLAEFNKILTQTSPDGETSESEMIKHSSLESNQFLKACFGLENYIFKFEWNRLVLGMGHHKTLESHRNLSNFIRTIFS